MGPDGPMGRPPPASRPLNDVPTPGIAPPDSALTVWRMVIPFMLDNFSAHVSGDIRAWAADHNVELAFVPF